MLCGRGNQESDHNFRIETLLLERFEVFRNRKDQTIGAGNQLRISHTELRNPSIYIGFSVSESRPTFPGVEDLERDPDGHRGSSARSVQDVR